ncbi:MAG: GNAT family N-acetyltransferase [Ignavibacteriales bacterium]|nr:GNAT family N-acetyltransferase [Ignavibacteriales bacterium]
MMQKNFSPFPVLKTERLVLRKLSLDDAEEIFFLRSDEKVNKYLDRPRATSIEDAHNFINKTNHAIENNECIDWAITFKDDSGLIGSICLWNLNEEENKAEVGYELLPDFQGKGIAQEALSAVITFGFEVMKLKTIEAYTHKENLKSTKLLEKFNFKRDLAAESKIDFSVDNQDTVVFSLWKEKRN